MDALRPKEIRVWPLCQRAGGQKPKLHPADWPAAATWGGRASGLLGQGKKALEKRATFGGILRST